MKSENGISIKRILFFDFHIYQNEILNMNLISIINDIIYLKTNIYMEIKILQLIIKQQIIKQQIRGKHPGNYLMPLP